MVTETQLHEKLSAAGNDESCKLVESNKRKGYMGFVKSLATLIQINSSYNEALNSLLESSPSWETFISGDYSESLRLEGLSLGGATQTGTADNSDTEEVCFFP